jgi:hypothetical protein
MLTFCRHVSLVGAALAVLMLSGARPAAAAYIAIDLNPSGFVGSEALGVSGGQQVGSGFDGITNHALLWAGSAASVVDLHSSEFFESRATASLAVSKWALDSDLTALEPCCGRAARPVW